MDRPRLCVRGAIALRSIARAETGAIEKWAGFDFSRKESNQFHRGAFRRHRSHRVRLEREIGLETIIGQRQLDSLD